MARKKKADKAEKKPQEKPTTTAKKGGGTPAGEISLLGNKPPRPVSATPLRQG